MAVCGQAYYAFSRGENVRLCEFRDGEPLIWALDFNVHSMCAELAQYVGRDIQVLEEMVLTMPTMRTTTSNPGVRDRVSLVNSRLLNAAGERRLFVDPKCRELIRDLERVRGRWMRRGSRRVS